MAKSPWPQILTRQRHLLGLNQDKMGERAGVAGKTWMRWERDGFSPSEKQQEQVAAGFGCTVEELRTRVARETMGQDQGGNGSFPQELAALAAFLQGESGFSSLGDRGVETAIRAGEGLVQVLARFEELSQKDPFVENLLGVSPGSGPESLADLSQHFLSRHYVVVTSILQVVSEIHAAWPRFEAEATAEEQGNVVQMRGELSDLTALCLSISQRLGKIRSAATAAEIAAMDDDDPTASEGL